MCAQRWCLYSLNPGLEVIKSTDKEKELFTSFLHHTKYIHSFSWTFQHTPSRPVNCSSIRVKLCSVLVTQTWSLTHFLSKRWILWNSGGHMQNYKVDDLSLWCVNVDRHCSVFVYIHSFGIHNEEKVLLLSFPTYHKLCCSCSVLLRWCFRLHLRSVITWLNCYDFIFIFFLCSHHVVENYHLACKLVQVRTCISSNQGCPLWKFYTWV